MAYDVVGKYWLSFVNFWKKRQSGNSNKCDQNVYFL